MPGQECASCGASNPQGQAYCVACGSLLRTARRTGDTHLLRPDPTTAPRPVATAYVGEHCVRIVGEAADTILEAAFEAACVLGRSGEDVVPDVDLTPYDALMLGVSRRHLKLIRQGDQVLAQDLGGINGSSLNGRRLLPYEPQAVCNGDCMSLGQLVLRVSFGDAADVAVTGGAE